MARRRFTTATIAPTATKTPLPKGIIAHDLKHVGWDDADNYPPSEHTRGKTPAQDVLAYEDRTFDLWLVTAFGWVIPTLSISHSGQRTYAVAVGEGGTGRVSKGAQVRVGRGPHVLAQHTVYIRQSRLDVLRPFVELRRAGAVDANVTRDRISSRRAQGQVERSAGNRSWRWDV